MGDIDMPASLSPMDFSAWFEAHLEDPWWTFDARHNQKRVGRVLMATGRDALDVAITTSFGIANLTQFTVLTEELSHEEAYELFDVPQWEYGKILGSLPKLSKNTTFAVLSGPYY
jgi:transglutaminase-like putative cysteine protease